MKYTLQDLKINIDSLDQELWVYVANTNNRYLISNMGRLITTRYKNSNRCALMTPAKDAKGYLRTMIVINGRLKTIKIHRIVAENWIDNPLNKPQVNHKNFIRDDNRVDNLEWSTPKENFHHSYEKNRIHKVVCTNFVKGSKIGTSKLTEEQVSEIRKKFIPRVYTRKMLAEEYKVSHHTIKDVILRRWKHVS